MPAVQGNNIALLRSRREKEIFGRRPTDSKSVGKRRKEVLEREDSAFLDKQGQINVLLAKYDTNRSGALEKDQLKALIVDFSKTLGASAGAVRDPEIDDLMKMCDVSKSGAIDREEVLWAVEVWRRHLVVLPEIEPLFARYDKDKTGRLNIHELQKLLTELNDGIEVDDVEAEWVLRNADKIGNGKIGRLEMQEAIAFWETNVSKDDTDDLFHAGFRGKGSASSACCSVQ